MADLGIVNSNPDSASGNSAHIILTLINALFAAKSQISSPDNYPSDYSYNLKDQDEFDFIVIGAGSAGSGVANKLSGNSEWKVLVIEAGDIPSSISEIPSVFLGVQKTSEDWQFEPEIQEDVCLGFKGKLCRWPRGKVFGGSSSINGNLYVRGNRRDYDQWAQQGNTGWDWESVLIHYKEMEDLQAEELVNSKQYGRGGLLPLSLYHTEEPILEAIKESALLFGYPTVLEEQNLGFFESVQTIQKGVRQNAGKVFLGKVKARSNLKVALNSIVEKIIINDQKRVEGVVVNIRGNKLILRARKEVIVSAGAISSPQILMLSGIGPKSHLEQLRIKVVQDLQVGKNLQDHVAFAGLDVSIPETAVRPKKTILGDIYDYFMYQKGPLGQVGIMNFMGFVNTRNDSGYPNMQYHYLLFEKNDQFALPILLDVFELIDEINTAIKENNQQKPTFGIFPILLNPKSRGEILLRSTNPLDKPIIYHNYFEDFEDAEILFEGIKFAVNQLESEPFKKFNPKIIDLKIPTCTSYKFNSDDYWRCAIKSLGKTLFHPAGTCKMGLRSDPEAVVDARLKVHGIENLRVIDASIMPLITSGNTNAPSLMIGMKGGSMVVEDWSSHSHNEL